MVLRGSNVPEEFRNGPHHSNGSTRWYLNGKLHREDGPASIWVEGRQNWYLNGERHRTDGPAIVYPDGRGSFWLRGYWMLFNTWLEQTTGLTDDEKVMLKLQYG
jgi:hypothetical protein